MRRVLYLLLVLWPLAAWSEIRLAADPRLDAALDYLLPRFSLKHGVRVTRSPDAPDAVLSETGDTPVLSLDGTLIALSLVTQTDETRDFADWLTSDIGQRTMASVPGGAVAPIAATVTAAAPAPVAGDAARGRALAVLHCARCHVVDEANRFTGIGSAPSFGAMRGFSDWRARFDRFHELNPHPSFTQVDGVTPPFIRQPHIAPIRMTPDEVAAVTAFAARLAPKDLGATVQPR